MSIFSESIEEVGFQKGDFVSHKLFGEEFMVLIYEKETDLVKLRMRSGGTVEYYSFELKKRLEAAK